MAAKYVTILEGEFDALLQPEKGWKKDYSGNAEEIIYKVNLPSRPHIQIKVYSSIHKNSSVSRPVGQDAIRICAINTNTNKGVRKARRVNRVPGWDVRLKERVVEIWNDLKNETRS